MNTNNSENVTASPLNNRRPHRILVPVLLALSLVIAGGPAWAVHDITDADNIELDGNTVNDGPGTEGQDEWDDVYADCGTSGPCDPVTTNALRQALVDDSTPDDSTAFKAGLKDTQPVSNWACRTQGVQGKSDIMYAYAATYQDNGDIFLYAGGDRRTVEGSANFGIWLNQEAVTCEAGPSGNTPFTGRHLDGDLFLVAEFDQGGSVSTINVYRWSDPDMIPENGDECLGGGAGDCSDEGATFLTGLNCATSGPGDAACGITNDLSTIDAAWRAGIGLNGFYEAGINLTEAIEGLGCFANVLIETRSSTSLTATIKDFVTLDLSTCGTLTVEKETVGADGTFDFAVAPDPDGGPFSLSGGESNEFGGVQPNTYTITESNLPSDDWELTDVTCVGGTAGAPTIGADGGSIEVDVGANDDVVCTFENTFTPPPSSITISKNCDSVSAGGQSFDFTLTGFGGSSTADCADNAVSLTCGSSISCQGLGAGDYTIDEDGEAGWELTAVNCTGTTTTCSTGGSPNAQITLAADDSASASFTNTEQASIQICKDVSPSGTSDEFAFTGDLGSFSLGDNECETQSVDPDTAYDVTETVKAGFTLDSISCNSGNIIEDAPTVTITPDPGESVSCTFRNSAPLPPAPPPPVVVTTLNGWALALMALMLLGVGWYFRPSGR
jgi:hypothetical protein